MRASGTTALALALSVLAPLHASADNVMAFNYVGQEQCVFGSTVALGIDTIAGAGPGWGSSIGRITFDIANRKAYLTEEGTFLGFDSGGFWQSQCSFDFFLSHDMSFTLHSTAAGCSSRSPDPSNATVTQVTNMKMRGWFSPDFQTYVVSAAGRSEATVENLVARGGPVGDTPSQRVCIRLHQGMRASGRR